LAFSFEWKHKRKMEEEQRSKDQSYKDHLHPKDGMNGIDAADHDELAHIPGGKGKDKTGKELVSYIFGVTGEDDETKGEVHGKGKRSRKRQDVHQSTIPLK
jgi:hypothetical protein